MKKLLLVLPLILFGCDNKPLSEAQQNFSKNCLMDIDHFMRDDEAYNSNYYKYHSEYGKHCDCVARKLSDSVASLGTFKFGFENLIYELKQCGADIYKK